MTRGRQLTEIRPQLAKDIFNETKYCFNKNQKGVQSFRLIYM